MSKPVSTAAPILLDGAWRPSVGTATFSACNPATGQPTTGLFPISPWSECERMIAAAERAFVELQEHPRGSIATFLDDFAARIEAHRDRLVAAAHEETALPVAPRLADVELPRTTGQLRLAAEAARTGSWSRPTIDTRQNIRSCLQPIGPVCVFGPNNFPFAFGSVSGGDFAAAIAAGNPVIGKANSSHPATTRIFAELAAEAVAAAGLPRATVQLVYRVDHEDGLRLVGDRRIGATAYTGSRAAGLRLKQAADAAGRPIYLELSSVNPVVILPGALAERSATLAEEYVGSVLMGTGQFCTNPGLVLLLDDAAGRAWIADVAGRFRQAAPGTLLSPAVRTTLGESVAVLRGAGGRVLAGGEAVAGPRCAFANTLLEISAAEFLRNPEAFQTEAFGNSALVVLAAGVDEMRQVVESLEGSLTGCICSSRESDRDEAAYEIVAAPLVRRVGRLLNDKMPTGVAVSPAMNHGGPFPATGHPGFTAVGIPASLCRFAKLTCFDAVRQSRLPAVLRDANATPRTWRLVDGAWTTADLGGPADN